MKTIFIKGENVEISDGFHTFDELYDHRCLLFINLCLLNKEKCAWKHANDDWFVLYYETEFGQISYHIPDKYLYLISNRIKNDEDYKWDGHTSEYVIAALCNMAEE